MNYFSNKVRKTSGFTLVEMGIVISIGAVILTVALQVVPRILASNRANAEIANLPQIAFRVQKVFINYPSFEEYNSLVMAQVGVFGDEMVVRATNQMPTGVKNRWGGDVQTIVPPATAENPPGSAFTLVYHGVPSQECKELIAGVAPTFKEITVQNISANTAVKNRNTDGRLDYAKMGLSCGDGRLANIAFSFGK